MIIGVSFCGDPEKGSPYKFQSVKEAKEYLGPYDPYFSNKSQFENYYHKRDFGLWREILGLNQWVDPSGELSINQIWSEMVRVAPPTREKVRTDRSKRSEEEGQMAKNGKAAPKKQRIRIDPDTKIKILTEKKANPFKSGSINFEKFSLYKDGMTVKEAREAGVEARFIRYHEKQKHLSLVS